MLQGIYACADWLIRKSMTDAYVTLPPESISLGGHHLFFLFYFLPHPLDPGGQVTESSCL